MKKIFFIILILFSTSNLLGKYEPVKIVHEKNLENLTIDQAVKSALKRKPSVHAFQYDINNFRRQRKSTLSPFLPNVTLSEYFYNTKNPSNIKSSFGIVASQTVINRAQKNYVKVYDSYVDAAKHRKESHVDLIRLETESAFLNAWFLQKKQVLINLLYNSSKENIERAENRFKNNLLDKNDWLKEQTTHSQNLAIVNSYKDEINEAQKTLEYYINIPIKLIENKTTKLTWNPYKKIDLRPISFYYQKALKNRKDLRVQKDAINTEKYMSKYYANQYVPSVSLFGNASKNTLRAGCSTFNKNAGIMISWNAFDGLSNYFNKSAADARKMKAILEKNDLATKIKLDVQKAYSALEIETKNLKSQNFAHNQAKNEFELRKQEFEAKLISKVDFQSAKYSYENARISWFSQAVITALKHQELLFSCGYPKLL